MKTMKTEERQRLAERAAKRRAAGLPRKVRRKSSVETELLRPGDCAALLGVSRLTVYRYEKTLPGFPKRRRLSLNVAGWLRSEILAWLKSRGPGLEESGEEARSA